MLFLTPVYISIDDVSGITPVRCRVKIGEADRLKAVNEDHLPVFNMSSRTLHTCCFKRGLQY